MRGGRNTVISVFSLYNTKKNNTVIVYKYFRYDGNHSERSLKTNKRYKIALSLYPRRTEIRSVQQLFNNGIPIKCIVVHHYWKRTHLKKEALTSEKSSNENLTWLFVSEISRCDVKGNRLLVLDSSARRQEIRGHQLRPHLLVFFGCGK